LADGLSNVCLWKWARRADITNGGITPILAITSLHFGDARREESMLSKEQAEAAADALMSSDEGRQSEHRRQRKVVTRRERIGRRWVIGISLLLLLADLVAALAGNPWATRTLSAVMPGLVVGLIVNTQQLRRRGND
jgi:hypothetical protein